MSSYATAKTSTVQLDCLLNDLSQRDRKILINQGFRILKAVGLQDWTQIKEVNVPKRKRLVDKKPLNRSRKAQRSSFSNGWSFERKFPNKQIALEFLLKDNHWRVDRRKLYKVVEGRKVHYRCIQAKQNKLVCGAEKCLFYPFDSDKVSLYKRDTEHTNHSDHTTDNAASVVVSNNSTLSETPSELKDNHLTVTDYLPEIKKFNTTVEDELIIKVEIEADLPENAGIAQTAARIDETEVRNSIRSSPKLIKNKNQSSNMKLDHDTIECCLENNPSTDCSSEIRMAETIVKKELIIEDAGITQTATRIDETEVPNSIPSSPNLIKNKYESSNMKLDYVTIGSCLERNIPSTDYSSEIRIPETILKEELIIEDVLDPTSIGKEIDPSALSTEKSESEDTNSYPLIPGYFFKHKCINRKEAMSKLKLETDQWIFICSIRNKVRDGFDTYNYFKCNYDMERGIPESQRILVHGKSFEGVLYYESYPHPLDIPLMENETTKDSVNSNDTENGTDWIFDREFDNYTVANNYLQSLNLASFIRVTEKSGHKQYYRCSLPDGTVHNCSTSRYLQHSSDLNNKISLYIRNIQHVDICKNRPTILAPLNVMSTNVINVVVDSDNNVESNAKKTWLLEQDFKTFQDAITYLKERCIWSYKSQRKLKQGYLTFYRCNLARGPECAAAKFIKVKNSTNVVSLYKTEKGHTHNTLERYPTEYEAFRKLDHATKTKIKKLVGFDYAPERIIEILKLNKFSVSLQQQLCDGIRIMRQYKSVNITSFRPSSSLNTTIENWLSQIKDVPNASDQHEPYCVSFDVDQNGNFRYLLSTRSLLNNAVNLNSIHIDSSQVLRWRKKTITIVGATDLNLKFHVFGISLSSKKDQSDFEFIFQAIQKGVQECHNQLFIPRYLICDEKHIHNAGFNVFGSDCTIGACPKAVFDRFNSYLTICDCDNAMKTQIRQDMLKICQLTSRTLFLDATKLFFEKWQPWAEEPLNQFLDLFKIPWVDRISNWFEMFPHFIPNTNKAILFEYHALGKNDTFKPSLTTASFLYSLTNDVENLSCSYATNGPKIIDKVPIPIAVYKNAIEWKNFKRQYKIVENRFETRYYFSTEMANVICEETFQNYQTCQHPTLDDFFAVYYKFLYVARSKSSDSFSCNCKSFWKNFVCQHSVGMGLLLKSKNGFE